jgi:hypothetical protein
MEISDIAINTGFGMVLARSVGDSGLARAFERYASERFDAEWDGTRFSYRGAARTVHSTALYALAGVIETGGDSFVRLFNEPLDRAEFSQPGLSAVTDVSGRVGVSRAEYDPQNRVLSIGLRQVGDPTVLRDAPPLEVLLDLENLAGEAFVEVAGAGGGEYRTPSDAGALQVPVQVRADGETLCALRLS